MAKKKRTPPHAWTPEQDSFLLSQHGILSNKDIAELLGVTEKTAKHRWTKLTDGTQPWTVRLQAEAMNERRIAAFLKDNIDDMTWKQMSEATGTSGRVLNRIAAANGIAKAHEERQQMTTEAAVEFLKRNLSKMSYKELSAATGYHRTYVQKLAAKNGLKKTARPRLTKEQTTEAVQFLRLHIDDMTWSQMADETGHSQYVLQGVARRNGIVKKASAEGYADPQKTAALKILKQHIDDMTWPQLSAATGLSSDQLRLLCEQNGIQKTPRYAVTKPMSPERQAEAARFIELHLNDMSWAAMAGHLNCSRSQVETLARKNGLRKAPRSKKPVAPRMTPEQVADTARILTERTDITDWAGIMATTGCTRSQLKSVARKTGTDMSRFKPPRLDAVDGLEEYLKSNINTLSWTQMAEQTGQNAGSLRSFAARLGLVKTVRSDRRKGCDRKS